MLALCCHHSFFFSLQKRREGGISRWLKKKSRYFFIPLIGIAVCVCTIHHIHKKRWGEKEDMMKVNLTNVETILSWCCDWWFFLLSSLKVHSYVVAQFLNKEHLNPRTINEYISEFGRNFLKTLQILVKPYWLSMWIIKSSCVTKFSPFRSQFSSSYLPILLNLKLT